jgi:Holliday junction resolvase-like predicted endonuclease
MTQFYEIDHGQPKLAIVSRALSWSYTLAIRRECEHYLWTTRQKWTSRQLERQIVNCRFERIVLSQTKLSAVPRELHPTPTALIGTIISSTCAMTSVKAFVTEGRRQMSPTFIHVAIP